NEILLRVTHMNGEARAQPPPSRPEVDVVPRLELRALSDILDEHHGRLTVESNEAATSYIMALPVRAVAPPPDRTDRPAWESAVLETVSLEGKHLVVVDDDEDARETLGALLRAHGAQVDSFRDGRNLL